MPTITGGRTRAQQVAAYAEELDAAFPGRGYGAQYTAYASAHPQLSARTALWLAAGLGRFPQALAKVLGAGISGTARATAAAGQASVSGLASLSPAAFLGELTSRALWVRVLKVIVGGVLLAAGAIQLSSAARDLKVIPA